jgi:hypothetical protein
MGALLASMGAQLRDLYTFIWTMIFMRKLKGVSLFNPIKELGIIPEGAEGEGDKDSILDLWG